MVLLLWYYYFIAQRHVSRLQVQSMTPDYVFFPTPSGCPVLLWMCRQLILQNVKELRIQLTSCYNKAMWSQKRIFKFCLSHPSECTTTRRPLFV